MAARSLSLAAYCALAGRGRAQLPDRSVTRPSGDLVWLHLGNSEDLLSVAGIADRLTQTRLDLSILVTLDETAKIDWALFDKEPRCFLRPAPSEHPKAVAAFLEHWKPDLALWLWGELRPSLVDSALNADIPMHLVAAQAEGFDSQRDRWLPEVSRTLLQQFLSVTVRSEEARSKLLRLGVKREVISPAPAMHPPGKLLQCNPEDLDEITASLSVRPVWLAAMITKDEIEPLLTALRITLRSAHRLMLVIMCADRADMAMMCEAVEAANLRMANWSEGEWPEDLTQVLLVDAHDELGLWYRVATLTFLGKSLCMGARGTDPLPAAALGTAILYGPHIRDHLPSYTRLANAGAARIVNDATSLGHAAAQLIQPDKAAVMAHAGWSVVSEGAEGIDAVLDLVQTALDGEG